jgi:hypothetical protein
MQKDGWGYTKYSQCNEPIYVNLYSDGSNDIYLPCAIFSKGIKNISDEN